MSSTSGTEWPKDRAEQTTIIMALLIQIGQQLDKIGEDGLALSVAKVALELSSKQVPENNAEQQSLESINSGLKQIISLIEAKRKPRIIQ